VPSRRLRDRHRDRAQPRRCRLGIQNDDLELHGARRGVVHDLVFRRQRGCEQLLEQGREPLLLCRRDLRHIRAEETDHLQDHLSVLGRVTRGVDPAQACFPPCARLQLVTDLAEEGADARLLFDRHPLGGGAARDEQDSHDGQSNSHWHRMPPVRCVVGLAPTMSPMHRPTRMRSRRFSVQCGRAPSYDQRDHSSPHTSYLDGR
jgi:hypothetical protein